MKRSFRNHILLNFSRWFVLLLCPIALARSTIAAQLKEASVTQIIKEVQLLPTQAAPRPAVLRENVREGTAVRTGADSRTELTFTDLTLARLGANTIFTFNEGTRNLNLGNGAMLLYVPKGAGGAKITTAGVTAGITGTTVIIEYHRNAYIKFITLEGVARVYLTHRIGESVLVHPGQMLIVRPDAKNLPDPVRVDLKRIVQTSLLITGFPPLPSESLIYQEVQIQTAAKASGQYVDTNLVIFGGGTLVSLVDPTNVNVVSQSTTANPPAPPAPPIPSKFGSPVTISSPVPYVIGSNTVITTDPTITTNGVTAFGTIYRGPAQDGPFSTFLFGSTSAFDLALKYDVEFFADPNNLPIAVFKFQSLSLIGNPTINLGNGGTTKLGLIGVDGITSGPPGGTLTFSGLDLLLLATQAGSINLTSDVSFQNIDTFIVYARGAGSNLTLASPILNSSGVVLAAEGSLRLALGITVADRLLFQTGSDLISTGSGKFTVDNIGGTINDGGRIRFKIGGNLSSQDLNLLIANNAGGRINTGGDIRLTIAGNLVTTGDASFIIQNTSGTIIDGGDLTLTVGGSISTAGAFNLLVANYNQTANPAGHIGNGGNIFLTTGGNVTADSMSVAINNRGGGRIDSDAFLNIDIAGALTTFHNAPDFLGNIGSLSLAVSTRYDGQFGNTAKSFVGGDAVLLFHADSASIGGIMNVTVSDRGGTIGGNALLSFDVTNDLKVFGADIDTPGFSAEAAVFEILNDAGTGAASPFGGNINGSATLQISAANMAITAGTLDVLIHNRNGGRIGSNATLSLNLAGDLTVHSGAFFTIFNNVNEAGFPGGIIGSAATLTLTAANVSIGTDFSARILNHHSQGVTTPGAGSIGTDATINISALNFNVDGFFEVEIFNRLAEGGSGHGGSIGGNATINFDLAGNLNVQHEASFAILNESVVPNLAGGTIGGNATINLTAANVAIGTVSAPANLNVFINNSGGGSIGGKAAINMNVSGKATVTNDATVAIYGSDGAASAAINILGGSYNVGGTFLAFTDGDGTITFNNASAHADLLKVGAFGPNGVLNIGGGTLSADTTLDLYATGSNGKLNFVSNVTLGGAATKILAADSVTIFNGVVVTINGPAAQVYTNHANYTGFSGNGSTTGTFAGSGALDPQPLDAAPAFDDLPPPPATGTATATASSTGTTSKKTTGTAINVTDSGQLLSLLDTAGPGPGGNITIPASMSGSISRNSGHAGIDNHLKTDRGALGSRSVWRLPQ
jgi:hypothetical protein